MKTAIAIRHVCFEDLGTLQPLLESRGYAIQYIDATDADLGELNGVTADLLILLGGPIGAYDDEAYPFILKELVLVRQWLEHQRPLLGICLGAQLIARAMGARVNAMGVKEIGFAPLMLTQEGDASPLGELGGVPILHWHGDRFDIPPGAVRLAGTETCANQAFAVGRYLLGLQFHLEVDPRQIERWLVGHAGELALAGIDPRTLRSDGCALQTRLPLAAHAVFTRWLDDIEENTPRNRP